MAACHYHADNLCAILDWNGVQATGETEKIFAIGNLKEKWASFGWNVLVIDGHDIEQILGALDEAKASAGRPSIIIAKTIKGKGFPFAEGKAKYHNASMTDEEYATALRIIEDMRERV